MRKPKFVDCGRCESSWCAVHKECAKGPSAMTETTPDQLAALDRAATQGLMPTKGDHTPDSRFIAALWNAYRAKQLVLIGPDAVEKVARALAELDGLDPNEEWDAYEHKATAALAALGVK